jgi:hypothetical protein
MGSRVGRARSGPPASTTRRPPWPGNLTLTRTASGPPVTTTSRGCRSAPSVRPTWPLCSPTSTTTRTRTTSSGPVGRRRWWQCGSRPASAAPAPPPTPSTGADGPLSWPPGPAACPGGSLPWSPPAWPPGWPRHEPLPTWPPRPGSWSRPGWAGCSASAAPRIPWPGGAARARRAAHRPPPGPTGAARLGGSARPGHPGLDSQHRSPGHRPRRGGGHRLQAVSGAAPRGP